MAETTPTHYHYFVSASFLGGVLNFEAIVNRKVSYYSDVQALKDLLNKDDYRAVIVSNYVYLRSCVNKSCQSELVKLPSDAS